MGWFGFDFDGTLCTYQGWMGPEHIGEPIKPMCDLVRKYLADGKEVRIVTARVSNPYDENNIGKLLQRTTEILASRKVINDFCMTEFGRILSIVCEKDQSMITLYDDRCKQVIQNSGILVEDRCNDCTRKYIELKVALGRSNQSHQST